MAKWESKKLGTPGFISDIAEQAEAGITTINSVLEVVKGGAEVAKLFLTAVTNPALLAVTLLADQIILVVNDYRNLGFYALFIDPTDPTYGAKIGSQNNGYEIMNRDGNYLFEVNYVENEESFYWDENHFVNTEYEVSGKLEDLSTEFRDIAGRNKNDTNFIPPIPILVKPLKLVIGGYNPASWDGNVPQVSGFPSFPATRCLELMSSAFDDEGDIPRFEISNKKQGKKVYTAAGDLVSAFDPNALYKIPLYEKPDLNSKGKVIPLTSRGEVTKRIKSGRPMFEGAEIPAGVEISALVVVAGTSNFTEFVDIFESLSAFFGKGIPEFDKALKALKKMLTPDEVKLIIEVDTLWGNFEKGDLIKGWDSGAVGEITRVGPDTTTKPNLADEIPAVRTEITYTLGRDKDTLEPKKLGVKTRDLNQRKRWMIVEIAYAPKWIQTNKFNPGEKVYEAESFVKETGQPPTPTTYYKVKGIDVVRRKYRGRRTSFETVSLPKYGFVQGINPVAPASVPPDFFSITAAELIPGWTDFFDGIAELAEGIKGFAEDATAFIQSLIDTIDAVIARFEELVEIITEFLEFFKIGLPPTGIYLLAITTKGGNAAIQSAITSSDNSPPATLTYSAGFMLIAPEAQGLKPLPLIGELLGIEFQSV